MGNDERASDIRPGEPDVPPVVSFRLTYDDLYRTMLEYWGTEAGFVSKKTIWMLVAFWAGVTIVAACTVYAGMILPCAVTSAASGFLLSDIWLTCRTLKIRTRTIGRMWERLKKVSLHVDLYYLEDGIRFTRGDVVQDNLWIEVADVKVRTNPMRWVLTDSTGDVSWVPSSAFDSIAEFEAFADKAYEQWRHVRPLERGFDVVPRTES